jgi:GNAT superfamily N-acetyltransferase
VSAPSGFVIESRPYTDPDVVRLVDEVQQEYVARYGGPDSAAVYPDEFAPPAGLFLVGLLDGVPVATGGWRRLDEPGYDPATDAEIKRMYVTARARRLGLARRMLTELERTAAAAGVERLVLNTGSRQPEAVALYESAGYDKVPGFGYYLRYANDYFYGKKLGSA